MDQFFYEDQVPGFSESGGAGATKDVLGRFGRAENLTMKGFELALGGIIRKRAGVRLVTICA
jgi:hypothetical protein